MENIRGKRSNMGLYEDAWLPEGDLDIILWLISTTTSKKALKLHRIYCNTKKFRTKNKLWNRVKKEYEKEYNKRPKIIGVDLASNKDSSYKTTMRQNKDGLWTFENSERIK